MKLGKVLTLGLIGSAGVAASQSKKTDAECSLPKMKQESDKWVKSQAKALATCTKAPFDTDACLMDILRAAIPEAKVKGCLVNDPSLEADPTFNENVRDAKLLLDLTKEVVILQTAKAAKQEKIDKPSAKNHSHFRLHREL